MGDRVSADITAELDQFRRRYQQLNKQISSRQQSLDWSTENAVVLEHGAMRLRQFEGGDPAQPPLLLVYSHVNSPCVIDLHPDHSLVKRLIDKGQRVYLLDWGTVSESDRDNDIGVYAEQYIDAAVTYLQQDTGFDTVNLLGICQGGTFALCYASMYPAKVNRLVTVVAPVDFHAGESLLMRWSQYIDLTALDSYPQNVPGALITMLFQMMRPFEDMIRQVQQIDQPENARKLELVIKMDQWVYHCPDQPGRAFAQFVNLFYQNNALVNQSLLLSGRQVDLHDLTMPVLNVYASEDHLVPPASSMALGKFVERSKYRELEFKGGHIGLLVSTRAQQTVLPEIGEWLAGRKK
ncbi:MAG: alpha/beta fold hydrolase [bacterium]